MSSWTLVFVTDRAYVDRYRYTLEAARGVGKWDRDIVCLAGPDIANDPDFVALNQRHGVEIKKFPEIDTTALMSKIGTPFTKGLGNEYRKRFQYHKFHVFDDWFRKWDYVFYLDCGLHIHGDLNRFTRFEYTPGYYYAHCDNYPRFKTCLRDQFEPREPYISELAAKINLDHYAFQTTVQIFHTQLLAGAAKDRLIEIMEDYPIALTNDQPITNILFNSLWNCWRWLPIRDKEGCLYDYFPRFEDADKYVMVKDNSRNI